MWARISRCPYGTRSRRTQNFELYRPWRHCDDTGKHEAELISTSSAVRLTEWPRECELSLDIEDKAFNHVEQVGNLSTLFIQFIARNVNYCMTSVGCCCCCCTLQLQLHSIHIDHDSIIAVAMSVRETICASFHDLRSSKTVGGSVWGRLQPKVVWFVLEGCYCNIFVVVSILNIALYMISLVTNCCYY